MRRICSLKVGKYFPETRIAWVAPRDEAGDIISCMQKSQPFLCNFLLFIHNTNQRSRCSAPFSTTFRQASRSVAKKWHVEGISFSKYCPNKWKSVGVESGEYDACGRTSPALSSSLVVLTVAFRECCHRSITKLTFQIDRQRPNNCTERQKITRID